LHIRLGYFSTVDLRQKFQHNIKQQPAQRGEAYEQVSRRNSMTMKQVTSGIVSMTLFCCISILGSISVANADAVADGKKVAFDRKKGNCLACHAIAGGSLPGNIGPPLIAMKARFPEKAKLREQIWDSTAANPNTIMPPFGKHRILTEKEVDLVTEFIYTL
jgi:sulfur-oxidizing protein SoxX